MPISTAGSEGWGVVSPAYFHVERLTIPPAQALLKRVCTLLPLTSANATAFDNGCGPGVLSSVLKEQYPQVPLLATDASKDMIDILQRRIEDQKWENMTARVVDSRKLEGIKDGSFTHTFSTFMICMAPEPEKIVSEMRRVTTEGGVLGLATWGDNHFGVFSGSWEKACRQLISDYERPMLMDTDWTVMKNVVAGLAGAGFKDVDAWEDNIPWRWDSVDALSKYFFEGRNPGNVEMIGSFKARGGNVDEARPIFERLITEESGLEDGTIELYALAFLATARK